jgi:predicted metalloprotease with PDZ domain
MAENRELNLMNSLGIDIQGGEITDVQEDSTADKAKLGPGMRIASVDGRKYTMNALQQALHRHAEHGGLLKVAIDDYGEKKSFDLDYRGTVKIPHLKRIADHPDFVTPVGEPHAAADVHP